MGVERPVKPVHRVLPSLNCDGRLGLALLAACALLLLPALAAEPGRVLLRYDRVALAAGQWWRLLSAHVVHLSVRHALVNCLGLVLLWALFLRDYAPRRARTSTRARRRTGWSCASRCCDAPCRPSPTWSARLSG